ncbi:hypothetical protein GCM10009677_03790 [Sphaerisporangium rubeum]|uniref:Putative membrane protein YeiB n=1 Tax=Sphaerisporangium rubeum TaxID=321317 RepID=A0A7X0M3M6_9ACTN|nr:DUF418 domain-containing protein [Sphaerisporangium rubeum]MBB6470778.1 putative membrane protein YeiB [Sphaerisporangium rubeum]
MRADDTPVREGRHAGGAPRSGTDPGGHEHDGTAAGPRRRRIAALDVIRGVALCGILVVNVQPIAAAGALVVTPDTAGVPSEDAGTWLGLFTTMRFFPIFSFLFGVGFSLLAESAAARGAAPRVLLLRRLVALLVVGAAHHVLLWQGDILAVYAVVGLVVLLPSTWLPRWAVAWLAGGLLVAAVGLGGGQLALVPGLFLLGSALTRYGVVAGIERSARPPAVAGLLLAAAAAPVLWWQASMPADAPAFRYVMPAGGLLVAGVYVCVLLVLLHTPLRPVLRVAFAPLGRMALTNYLTATVLVLAITPFLGGAPHTWPATRVLLVAAAILSAQWLFSALWLRRFTQGPLEWLWRWVTWARRPPLRAKSHGAYGRGEIFN